MNSQNFEIFVRNIFITSKARKNFQLRFHSWKNCERRYFSAWIWPILCDFPSSVRRNCFSEFYTTADISIKSYSFLSMLSVVPCTKFLHCRVLREIFWKQSHFLSGSKAVILSWQKVPHGIFMYIFNFQIYLSIIYIHSCP